MVRDAIVLGAGIVGTSVALHLAKRGLSVALVDHRGPGEGTSYGNTGVIVGASVFPTGFPRSLKKLVQVALKRAPEANYHFGDLMKIAPWLVAVLGLHLDLTRCHEVVGAEKIGDCFFDAGSEILKGSHLRFPFLNPSSRSH